MPQLLIVTCAVLVGLTPLIPIPVLDDLVKAFFYASLVRALAAAHNLALTPEEVNVLGGEPDAGCLPGCLFGAGEYLIKRLGRKITVVLEWRRAIDLATRAFYWGYLLDYALQQGWYLPGDVNRAVQLRQAIEQARREANTDFVKHLVQTSFEQSRNLILGTAQQLSASLQNIAVRRSRTWFRRNIVTRLRQRTPRLARTLYRWLQPTDAEKAQVTRVEDSVAQTLGQKTPLVIAPLNGLIAHLQDGLTSLPKEHFEGLQARLGQFMRPDTQG